jgi:UDP-N-acetylmuramoyl-L-alanyl-D-glutamate--2,6-diaminopimelate ligase
MSDHRWSQIFPKFPGTVPADLPIFQLADHDRDFRPAGGSNVAKVFFARRGVRHDGHHHIDAAIGNGANIVVGDRSKERELPAGASGLWVDDVQSVWVDAQRRWYGCPDERLRLHMVTGTNGKTLTVFALQHLLGDHCGRMGTVDMAYGKRIFPATATTPDAPDFYKFLHNASVAGCTHVALEITSHALAQRRLQGVAPATAIFTNLSHDHLDFHGTMEDYFDAKCSLFDGRAGPLPRYSAVNGDDPFGRRLIATLPDAITFGSAADCDWQLLSCEPIPSGIALRLRAFHRTYAATLPVLGRFNAMNILSALAIASLYEPVELLLDRLETFRPPPGRMERIPLPNGAIAIVDYAHSPNALEAALRAIRWHFPKRRSLLIFGCGGERDRTKRPIMAKIGENFADFVIVTDDNPRGEDPEAIAGEIYAGFRSLGHVKILDRTKAIALGVRLAVRWNAVLFVAGKGHESIQTVGSRSIPCNDREIVEKLLETF